MLYADVNNIYNLTKISNISKFRDLVDEYRRLVNGSLSPQERGRRFNSLIAEVLQCWGIRANPNNRSAGEIDVVFELNGDRFILEAKWEKEKIAIAPIAKLQKRVKQRLAGTIGIFLSMSGYTEEALTDIKDGERLEVILFMKEHWEAFLSGFFSPDEIISHALDKAHFDGMPLALLSGLYSSMSLESIPPIRFDCPQQLVLPLKNITSDIRAEVLISNLPFPNMGPGICEIKPGNLLVTLSDGIVLCDLHTKEIKPWIGIPNCHGNPLNGQADSVYIMRDLGVASVDIRGELSFIAGGYFIPRALHKGCENQVWIFTCGSYGSVVPEAFLVKVGDGIGSEERYRLSDKVRDLLPLPNSQFFWAENYNNRDGKVFVGLPHKGKINFSYSFDPNGYQTGAIMLSDSMILIVNAPAKTIRVLKLDSLTIHQIAKLNCNVWTLTPRHDGGAYLYVVYNENNLTKGAIIELSISS
jgi:Holliday junction resolvase-like predicted endonuclease